MIKLLEVDEMTDSREYAAFLHYCGRLINECDYVLPNDLNRIREYALKSVRDPSKQIAHKTQLLNILVSENIRLNRDEIALFDVMKSDAPLIWLTALIANGCQDEFYKKLSDLLGEFPELRDAAMRTLPFWESIASDAVRWKLRELLEESEEGSEDKYLVISTPTEQFVFAALSGMSFAAKKFNHAR